MKKLTEAMALTAILISFCATAHAGSTIYKNNALTASHLNPPGTHVSLVPPKGGVLSSLFAGFELPDRGRIQIIEKAGTPYKESEGILTKEGIEALGVSMTDKSPVNLNGNPATLVSGMGISDSSTGILMLVLGNEKMTVNIYGYYAAGDGAAEAAVKNSLLSCIFNPSLKSTSASYSLSAAGTKFKFSDEIGSTRYFTVGGVSHDEAVEALYTSTTADDYVPQEARNAYATAAIDKFLSPYPEHAVTSSRQVNFGGLPGIETIAEFDGPSKRTRTASGANVTRTRKGKAYQVLLFDENEGKIYVFSGIATLEPDSYVSQFAKITSTFVPGQ
jgi:hypothetical protein